MVVDRPDRMVAKINLLKEYSSFFFLVYPYNSSKQDYWFTHWFRHAGIMDYFVHVVCVCQESLKTSGSPVSQLVCLLKDYLAKSRSVC